MTEKVKKRIEDINNGIVPEGYKRVGKDIIPDDWEQRKLGDQMYIKARIGWQALTKSEYLQTGDYYLITGTDIDEDTHTVDLKRCFYVSKERYDMDDKIQVHEGDIIVTKDGTIGKVAMVTGLDKPATLNSHLFVLRDLSGNLDNYYLLTVLNSQIFNQFVEATKTGSTLTGLPQKTFVEFTFPVPSLEEQKQISGFFKSLDNTITLHQRKCDELKNLKKAYLTKMFPQKGQKRPEIRFSGFTDDWEQRKFGELYQINNERNKEMIGYDKTFSIATMTYKDEGNGASESSLSNYKVLRIGDVAFEGHANKEFQYGRFVANDVGTGIMSPRFTALRPINDMPVSFWKYYIHYEPIMRWKLVCSTKAGTMMNELVSSDFFNQDILVPSLEEQLKIGEFFNEMDTTITLHQRKCELLKMKKKALMQLLLTGKVRVKV